jgi:DNA-binding NarL/FixJ family response regulator
VDTAAGGHAALAAVARRPPSVIVLDVTMPDLDGVAVVRRLRADGVDVPVCILSARDDVEDRVAGLQAGADDYLVNRSPWSSSPRACWRCCAAAVGSPRAPSSPATWSSTRVATSPPAPAAPPAPGSA